MNELGFQEVYSVARQLLLTQNKKSSVASDGEGMCLYRSPDGCKCAIGALIKDEFYTPNLEYKDCNSISVGDALEHSGVSKEVMNTVGFLRGLQIIHDEFPVNEWEARLNDFAVKWKLEINGN